MLNISPVNIFPLKYPKSDSTIPPCGARVAPVTIKYINENACTVFLVDIQQQKNFDSLRCVWVDTLDCLQDVLVEIAGTGQRFSVPKQTTGYYPVIVLNNPQIQFAVPNIGNDIIRCLFLNFIPIYSQGGASGGNAENVVSVDNFPAIQEVTVNNFPSSGSDEATDIVYMLGNQGGTKYKQTSNSTLKTFNYIRSINVSAIDAYTTQEILNCYFYDKNQIQIQLLAIPSPKQSALASGTILQLNNLKIPAVSPYYFSFSSTLSAGYLICNLTVS